MVELWCVSECPLRYSREVAASLRAGVNKREDFNLFKAWVLGFRNVHRITHSNEH